MKVRSALTCVIGCFALAAPAKAGTLGPRTASSLVNAMATTQSSPACGNCPGKAFDTMIVSDGTEVPFSIPAGQVFVVTHFEWGSSGGVPSTLEGGLVSVDSGTSCAQFALRSESIADASGNAAGQLALTDGIAVKSGKSLCLLLAGSGSGKLYGYFANDR